MTGTYENVKKESEIAKSKRRRRSGRHPVWRSAILSAVTYVVALLAIIMYAKDLLDNPVAFRPLPDPLPAQTHHPLPKYQPMEPSHEEPAVESQYVLYDVQLSEELQRYTQDACEEYEVSYPLVIAIMKKESEFSPDAISTTNDYGIMQINRGNHEWLEENLGITDWFDPKQNILAGIYMLSQFNGYEDVHQILMSYNCGPSGAKKLWAEGIYTTAYSRAVVEILDGLEVMNDG